VLNILRLIFCSYNTFQTQHHSASQGYRWERVEKAVLTRTGAQTLDWMLGQMSALLPGTTALAVTARVVQKSRLYPPSIGSYSITVCSQAKRAVKKEENV
jgi:hypothetical protein